MNTDKDSIGDVDLEQHGKLWRFEQLFERQFARLRLPALIFFLAVTVVFGALLGVLVTISSVGAGALGVTVLILLYPNLPITRVVGSDIAHAVPLTLLAGLGHWLIGSVNGTMLAALLLGSMPGIVLGSHFAGRVPEKLIRILLAAVLLVVGGRLVIV